MIPRHDVGSTPLDPNESEGLLPSHLATQQQLNAWEQRNILDGESWALRQKSRRLLDDAFARELHRRMFNETWSWAGQYRRSDKNLGCPWREVPVRVRQLMDDCCYWIEHATHPLDECAVRFHHALVSIHPFPNGNGRHSRLMADLVLLRHGAARFSWGGAIRSERDASNAVREDYLKALREADRGDFSGLMRFTRG